MVKITKKIVPLIVAITMILTVGLLTACDNGGSISENDFELTIALSSNEVMQGEYFTMTVTLRNVSGRRLRYWSSFQYPLGWNIEGWQYGAIEEVCAPAPSAWSLSSNGYIQRVFKIYANWHYASEETDWFEVLKYQEPNDYEIIAVAGFYTNRQAQQFITIRSNAEILTVLEK